MDPDIDRRDAMMEYPSPFGDIYLGPLHVGLPALLDRLNPSDIMVVADENTARYCVPQVRSVLGPVLLVIIPAGESHKDLESCRHIWSSLIEMGADRAAMILNVGGGLVCDAGGFAASCYQRGIRFGHLPTSLLAMADAAIGGKTGVNFQGYKNYIGRIEAPQFIWIDPDFLKTLPEAEIRNGLTEIIKHAIIGSPALWDRMVSWGENDMSSWPDILEENIPVKKRIVEEDPYEKGLRKVLNFGHTIGHALESYFLGSPTPLSHGEAVTLGMMAESKLALDTGRLSLEDFNRILSLIRRLLRPAEVPLPSYMDLRRWLEGDKKKQDGAIRYSLPEKIGSCAWNVVVEDDRVAGAIHWLSTQGIHPSQRLSEAE